MQVEPEAACIIVVASKRSSRRLLGCLVALTGVLVLVRRAARQSEVMLGGPWPRVARWAWMMNDE